jgi:hypothetical protein
MGDDDPGGRESAMSEQRNVWREVSDRLDALALKLKMHVEQANDDDEGLSETLRDLRGAVDDAFEAASHAMKDEAVREDVREVGRLLTDAVANTLARAGDDVRDLFQRRP